MIDDRFLKGVDITISFPIYGANVDILSIDDGFLLLVGSENSRSDAGIWASCFPAHRCPDGLFEHTLRGLS